MKRTLQDLIDYIKKEYSSINKRYPILEQEIYNMNTKFPLDNLLNMTLEDYVTNGNYDCFINLIENKTNSFVSGFLGSNENRIFYHSNKDNMRHFNKKLLKYKEFSKYRNDVDSAFELYKKAMYDFIINFDENNYNGHVFVKYSGNVIPCKLLMIYRPDQNIAGFSSKDYAKQFAKYFNIKTDKDDDVISMNIKIRNTIINYDNKIKNYNYHIVGRIIWDFASLYIFKAKYLREDRIDDSKFIDEVNSISEKDLTNFDVILEYRKSDLKFKKCLKGLETYKRNPRIAAEAQKRANYKCYFDTHDGKHDSFYRKDGTKYIESHHIIPIFACVALNKNLDRIDNIVCLCSECHNKLHYGVDNEFMIKKLYKDKGDYLNNFFNINLSYKKYKDLYNNKKININD